MNANEDYKQFEEQHSDESVVMLARNHPVVLRKPLIVTLIILMVSLIPWSIYLTAILAWVALGGFLLSAIVMFYYSIGFHFSYVIITDQRVLEIKQTGFFKRSVVEVGLGKIQNVNYQVNGLQEHLLHFGTVIIQTFAGDLILDKLYQPRKFHEKLTRAIRENTRQTDFSESIRKEN